MSDRPGLNLTVRQIDIAGVVTCLLLSAVAYVAVVRPVASERSSLAALRGEIAAKDRQESAIQVAQQRIESELVTVRGEVEASPVRLESVTKLNHRLSHIEKAAVESNLLIHETRSSEVVTGDRYDTVPIEVSGSGAYPDCARFLRRLQQDLPEVEVLGFELSASPGEPRARPTFRFDLAWYAAPAVATAPQGSVSMSLSRNQKRYASILGVCALALIADRVLFAPSEAEADENTGKTTATTTPPIATRRDPLQTTSVPRKPLADRFATLAEEYEVDLASLSDPFQVPSEWLPKQPTGTVHAVVESDDPQVETFRNAHRLNAVMALESGGYAIVDGQRLRMGQEIDGFRLVEIRSRSIVLESRSLLRVELKLLDAGSQGGAPQSIRRPQ